MALIRRCQSSRRMGHDQGPETVYVGAGAGAGREERLPCKTSKLTDSQPGSDMQSRQQEQIAAVGGCHSCPIWQAVESLHWSDGVYGGRRGRKALQRHLLTMVKTRRKKEKLQTSSSVITQSIGLLSEFSNIAAFQVRNYELRLGLQCDLHWGKSGKLFFNETLLEAITTLYGS